MPTAPVLRTFVQCLIAFCSRRETAGKVVSGAFLEPIVHDVQVKFRDPRLNRSGEIPPEAVGGVISGRFSKVDNIRPEVASDVMPGVVADTTDMGVSVKFGYSRSHRSLDMRLPHFVMDDDERRSRPTDPE